MLDICRPYGVFREVKPALDFAEELTKKFLRPFEIRKPHEDRNVFTVVDVEEEEAYLARKVNTLDKLMSSPGVSRLGITITPTRGPYRSSVSGPFRAVLDADGSVGWKRR